MTTTSHALDTALPDTLMDTLMDILACPKCRGPLTLTPSRDGLTCAACRLRYRIDDGIPVMLVDEAERLG